MGLGASARPLDSAIRCTECGGPSNGEDANPLESKSAKSGLMASAASPACFVESFCPEGPRDGLADPLDEGLAEKRGARVAPVHPALVATALGDGSYAGILLQCGGVWEALGVRRRRRGVGERERSSEHQRRRGVTRRRSAVELRFAADAAIASPRPARLKPSAPVASGVRWTTRGI